MPIVLVFIDGPSFSCHQSPVYNFDTKESVNHRINYLKWKLQEKAA